MAIRQTRLLIKNSNLVNQPLPVSLLQGEAIVNTADGIMYFSGNSTTSSDWTPAGTGVTEQTFFEVGSNLYDLRLRNKITKYEDKDGNDLVGKFLSGTTSGFVLADISNIAGIDTYVTGSTLTSATNDNNSQTSQLEYSVPVVGGPYSIVTENTFTTGGTYDNNTKLITFDKNNGSGYTVDLSTIDTNDTYVTGGTNVVATVNSPNATIDLLYNQDVIPGTYSLPYSNVFTTGFTYTDNTFTIADNSGNTFNANFDTVTGLTINGDLTVTGNTDVNVLSANTLTVNGINITGDTYVTGGTYYTGGTIIFDYNTGGNFQVTGLTEDLDIAISGLAETDEVTIELDVNTNKIRLKDVVAAGSGGTRTFLGNTEIGTGGSLDVPGTGDLTVHGNLTVFGTETIVATSELYIEDPQITLNYNPTGSTTSTSVSSGIRIQDGNGIVSGDTYFTVGLMQNLVSGDTSEYTGLTGYNNRGWVTQLNDIVIRNTNLNDGAPDGVRVIAEGDILSGGSY
jgi:hypothetical protein